MIDSHVTPEPVLYLGTPVVLIGTQNEDGTANLAPLSSAWRIEWRCLLGLQTASRAPQDMKLKQQLGLVYEPSRSEAVRLTPVTSQTVAASRVLECPIQSEAVVVARHDIGSDDAENAGLKSAFEARVTRVHVHPSLLMDGRENRIDPAKWQPQIMRFQKLNEVPETEAASAYLAEIDTKIYCMTDVYRARGEPLESSVSEHIGKAEKR